MIYEPRLREIRIGINPDSNLLIKRTWVGESEFQSGFNGLITRDPRVDWT